MSTLTRDGGGVLHEYPHHHEIEGHVAREHKRETTKQFPQVLDVDFS